MRIVLAAEEAAGTHALHAVLRSGHELVAVLTSERGRHGVPSPVFTAATQLGHPVWPAGWVKDPQLAHRIRGARVDALLNVHSLFVINRAVIEVLPHGAYNMHPGPLPEYAGLNVISWALYRGETTHAVTIHRIVPDIDAGPIAYSSPIAIDDEDTAMTLGVKCVTAGLALLEQLLVDLAADPPAVPATPQDLTRRRYYARGVPNGGQLDWSRPARDVTNFVRACDYMPFESPWGFPKARLAGREVSIVKATLTGEPCGAAPGTIGRLVERTALVASGDDWVRVHRVINAGRIVDACDVLVPDSQFDAPAAVALGNGG